MKRYGLGEEGEMERIKLANVLMLLSRGDGGEERSSTGRVFECKTCNRQFSSFQALGGHRASHKKPRLMGDDQSQAQGRTERRVHQCSICGLQFAIGQALGGHMRRHRATTEGYGHGLVEKNSDGKKVLCLDLNLTPSENNVECGTRIFGIELVSRTPMVDCFH